MNLALTGGGVGRGVLAGVAAALLLLALAGGQAACGSAVAMVQQGLSYLRGCGIAGPAVFTLVQILIALSGAVPASLMGLAAGATYGLLPGFALAAGGSLVGAALAFALSRSLCRPAIERLLLRHGRLRRIDESVAVRGWKLVFLMRLSPVMPFSATSYLLGLSSVRPGDYLLGTLACLPALFGYVLVGTLSDAGLAAWTQGEFSPRLVALGAGAAATLLLLANLGRIVCQSRGSAACCDG
jgi:uncharacterized membrane protein YdjX (TVP38/TMEM64 family)